MNNVTLSDITHAVRNELRTFDRHFRTAMRSRIPFVDLIARYLIRQKGKRIRPTLVLLTARACGKINENTFRGAALVEILHTATLIHDDVVDDADTRRGLASINAVWKNKVAVLMGDYLYAKGLLLSLDHSNFKFLQIISNAVRRMSEGEIHQIAKSRALDIDERTYYRIIGDKTASLFSTCCEIGAASTTADEGIIETMRKFGENLGMAFQIRDDVLDYIGRKSITGKPKGLDLTEKKLTLPLIYALQKAPQRDARQILRIVKNGASSKALTTIVEFAHGYGGIDYAAEKAAHFSHLAKESLITLPESRSKETLLAVVDFVSQRSK